MALGARPICCNGLVRGGKPYSVLHMRPFVRPGRPNWNLCWRNSEIGNTEYSGPQRTAGWPFMNSGSTSDGGDNMVKDSQQWCAAHAAGCQHKNECLKAARCLDMSIPSHLRAAVRDVSVPATHSRVVISDDGKKIRVTAYDIEISPRRALQLAAELLTSALRALDREKE